VPKLYLDNVIVSGWVFKDLDEPEEMAAVERLYTLHEQGTITIVTSKMSGIEQKRTIDPNKRAALAASADVVPLVQNDHRLLGFNGSLDPVTRGFISCPILDDIVDHVLFEQLTKTAGLKDADDAMHIMYAAAVGGCHYFVTLDEKDILPDRALIESVCPQMKIVKPTEALVMLQA